MSNKDQSRISKTGRRVFIRQIGLGGAAALMAPGFSHCGSSHKSALFQSFLDPRPEAKPFFRWWWNGNNLSEKEIVRELKLMKDAGIGGIEINPIKMPGLAESPSGTEVPWLSDDWIDYLQFTIRKAKELGLITDLIVGTGWPFGGEFLAPEETIQGMTCATHKVNGPGTQTINLPAAENALQFEIREVMLYPANLAHLEEGQKIAFDQDQKQIQVKVPSGEHTLVILTWQNNFRSVMHGAPGGAGPVLDHFNKTAVVKYLNHMSDAIKQKTGERTLEGIRAMFCDSIELNGANWTSGFELEFEERRGYDIRPYLTILLADGIEISSQMEDEIKRARYDYSLTLAELFMENFIMPFHNWCHENGTLSRYQAYGHPWLYTDLVEGNIVPDIPEGDQWLFNGGWQPYADVNQIRYAIWNKYASSGGHLAGKKIISTEAMTNTSGVFKASLKYIKQATDLNIATGINHLVLHGFNYSPPEAEFPGWIRYGCYFNERNPWWQYMEVWSAYTSKVSQVFQECTPVSQVAIMGPTLDVWANYGLDRNHFNLEPWYLHALWQALNHNGFGTDYVNARLLKAASLKNGKLKVGKITYEVLLICDVETMEADLARHLEELALQGARIILLGKQPQRAPSMIGALKNNGIVNQAIENAMQAGLMTAPAPGEKLKTDKIALMKWADALMNNSAVSPRLRFSDPSPNLFQIHQKYGDQDIVFLTNMSEEEIFSGSMELKGASRSYSIWDLESAERKGMNTSDNHEIFIHLASLQSMLLVFDPNEKVKPSASNWEAGEQAYEIIGPWKVTLNHVDGTTNTIDLNTLEPINHLAGFQDFGGEIIYETSFGLADKAFTHLKLTEVYETAEIWLNGKSVGLSWWGNITFELQGSLQKGENTIKIKVTSLLANYCASLQNNKTAKFWTGKYKAKSTVKIGLVGKITLT